MLRLQNTPSRRFAGEHRGPHAEPEDYRDLQRIYSGRRAVAGTLQLPLQSEEKLRKRLSKMPEGTHHLVACVDGEVVGELGLGVSTNPRTRHTGNIGMAVHGDWQGKGIGTALMEAALDLADNWLNLTRIELRVYVDNAAGMALENSETPSVRFRALIGGAGAEPAQLVITGA